jgi:RNA polymerase sigma-70 factor (ECF subfamily)
MALPDEVLVAQARAGEIRAFEALVERYQRKAYFLARDMTGDSEEAKDLSQEAFLRAFSGLRGFREGASFRTWFYRIVINLVQDARRRKKRWAWLLPTKTREDLGEAGGRSELEQAPDPSANPERAALRVDLEMALRALGEKQRTTFILKHEHDLSVEEVARVMGVAEGTVKANLHWAVKHLRERLQQGS